MKRSSGSGRWLAWMSILIRFDSDIYATPSHGGSTINVRISAPARPASERRCACIPYAISDHSRSEWSVRCDTCWSDAKIELFNSHHSQHKFIFTSDMVAVEHSKITLRWRRACCMYLAIVANKAGSRQKSSSCYRWWSVKQCFDRIAE